MYFHISYPICPDTGLLKDPSRGNFSIAFGSSEMLECLLFSQSLHWRMVFQINSSHFWFHAICCYTLRNSPHLNLLTSGITPFTYPCPYLPTIYRSFSRCQYTQKNLPLHGSNCTSSSFFTSSTTMTVPYYPREQLFLGPHPRYHPPWFFLWVLKSHSPTVFPTTSHPSSSIITAFLPDLISSHWIPAFSLGLSAPSALTPFPSLPEVDDPLSPELMLGIFFSGLLFFSFICFPSSVGDLPSTQ